MADAVAEARARMYVGALEGLVRSAEDLLGKAQRDAPLDEGTLRGSAALAIIVNGSRFDGGGAYAQARAAARVLGLAGERLVLDAEVSFNTVYAARQHEELDWQHPRGGRAKYLEANLTANASRYAAIVAASARRGA